MSSLPWLPPLITKVSGEADGSYLDRVYETFTEDFIRYCPIFHGAPLQLRVYLEGGVTTPNGKEATFWHLTSDGPDEVTRMIDIARCERLGWIRAILDQLAGGNPDVRVWSQYRNGKQNYGVSISTFEYVLFLGERRNSGTGATYTLPLTAYVVERQTRRQKYEAEWQANRIYP